ncbi:UDP-N-acetylmuramoyl-tripeptide--D-alanyl-D-alanine ligase [Thermaurantiacus tibetensis]|uniref:UDP-N-acetylmuramoyl-tripeptide--D-alanyl-D- alanine ligase n=1 Tax=Thermaurantiacus tibetensis TaxID=2759035 RepID=UPI00188FB9D6|nr:UDP-N-acetylmuramoyl-tripeptide--D-alanyl-D-alanine ligase [Thermaurantiacus tibetensis]
MSGLPPPLWTAAEVAAATGGTPSAGFAAGGVSFDSREVLAGDLFVALPGTRHDGHAFVADARAAGAVAAVVARPVEGPHVLVPDTMAGLEALGRAARARTGATIVGVTGSVGKTGVKEALRRAFQRIAPDATHWSEKSYNNHTGVPLSLARMPAATRFGVFEMGMNHAGEIRALVAQVRPHVALVTWVAAVHIENFADETGIAEAKAEIFEGLEPGGTAILPADNVHAPLLRARAKARAARVLAFGEGPGADVRLLDAAPDADGTDIVADVLGERVACRVGLPGRHWVSNALAVLAAVAAAGGDLAEAGLALAALDGLDGRGARIRLALPGGEATLVDESYNANPTSMAAALAVVGAMPARRRLAILGAMKELGPHAPALHAGLAGPVASAGIAALALVGEEMQALRVDGATHLADWQEALAWARAMLEPGDVLLVKGSNSVGLGRLVAALAAEGRP